MNSLPLNLFANRVQRIQRLVAQANPSQIPAPLEMTYDIMLILR